MHMLSFECTSEKSFSGVFIYINITNIIEINIPASVTTIEANQLTTLNKLITNGVVINIDSNNASYEISNNKIVAK